MSMTPKNAKIEPEKAYLDGKPSRIG